MAFNITTTAFEEGKDFPKKHTCEGDDLSPPLRWDDEPKGTVSFAMIMEDPDAPGGTFTHWIMYNIPSDVHHLEEIIPIQKNLKNGAHQGQNDFGNIGYGGPCPPEGDGDHRYYFKIFALDKKLPPESANSRDDFYKAIKGRVLNQAEYMGKFRR